MKRLFSKFYCWFIEMGATWFGCGKAPIISGTFGTAGAIPLRIMMEGLKFPAYCLCTLIIAVLGVIFAHLAEKIYGKKDDGRIVIDEVLGYLITTLGPIKKGQEIEALIGGFLFFRLTDIIKPPPARKFEKLPGGIGVMADDLIAGLWALLLLRIWFIVPKNWKRKIGL